MVDLLLGWLQNQLNNIIDPEYRLWLQTHTLDQALQRSKQEYLEEIGREWVDDSL